MHAWCQIAAQAVDLLGWLRQFALIDGPGLACAEPQTVRYRLLHIAAKLASGQRRHWVNIPPEWH